jgi:hypothetical protein
MTASNSTMPTRTMGHSSPATAAVTPGRSGAATWTSRNHPAATRAMAATKTAMAKYPLIQCIGPPINS